MTYHLWCNDRVIFCADHQQRRIDAFCADEIESQFIEVCAEGFVLQEGMVFTVEPGLYIAEGQKKVAKKWWNIGVRIEDDVLVTKTGCEILTSGAPKTVPEIEAIMAERTAPAA